MSVTEVQSSKSDPEGEAPVQLERRLTKLNMVAMTFAILNTWIALAGSLGIVLPSGGPVALLYGFVFCVLCNLCLAASLGELASIWPTAGGQYHYAYCLGTERWKKFISFCVGWTSIAGWLTLVTTAAYFGAFFISAAAVMGTSDGYVATQWKMYLIFLAIIVFVTVSNLYGNSILGYWSDAALYWSILGVVVISIVLLSTSEKSSAEFVFTQFSNETGWTPGVAWMLGLLQSALSLIGFDASTHMAEEMPRPARDTPLAMVYTIGVGGVTGFVFILVMLFCLGDIETVLSSSTGMPITELIYQSTGSRAAAVVLSVALAICFINGTNAAVTTVSRLLYAMARDKGMPFPAYFSTLDRRFHVPSRTIIICFVFNACFGLLYLGPTVAFNAYAASTTIFLNISYAIPVLMVLIRGRSILQQHTAMFRLGKLGYVMNFVGVAFVGVTSVFFCFPSVDPVGTSNMNYVSAVLGIFAILMIGLWFTFRSVYDGPEIILLGLATQDSALTSAMPIVEEKMKPEV